MNERQMFLISMAILIVVSLVVTALVLERVFHRIGGLFQ